MIAVDGEDCIFYAIVLNPTGEPIPELTPVKAIDTTAKREKDTKERIYHNYIDIEENEKGTPTSIKFKNTERFNFAFDLVDALAEREPKKLALLHISRDGEELIIPAGEKLILEPGESILLERNVFHRFYAEEGADVLIGEVSAVNDDHNDNVFYGKQLRFPEIIEDEAPYRYLVSDYCNL
jgi:D-lyxose ketol-isomerase